MPLIFFYHDYYFGFLELLLLSEFKWLLSWHRFKKNKTKQDKLHLPIQSTSISHFINFEFLSPNIQMNQDIFKVCLENRTSFNFFNFFPNLSCYFKLNTSENWHLVKIFWKLQNFVLVLVWPKAGCIVSILIPNTNCYFRWLWSCNID